MIYMTHDNVHYTIKSGNANDFHDNLPAMRADINNMRVIHTGPLKWFKREDKWSVMECFGITQVIVHGGVSAEKKEKIFKIPKELKISYPVLGISMTTEPDYWTTTYQGDLYQEKTVLEEGSKNYYMDKDDTEKQYLNKHKRLVLVSAWSDVYGSYVRTQVYEYPDADMLLTGDFSYRNFSCDGHSWSHVRPVVFTCDDYEAVTTCVGELWENYDVLNTRAIEWNTQYDTGIVVNGISVMSTVSLLNHYFDDWYKVEDYEFTETNLLLDGFTAEEIGDRCVPFDTYELWYKSGWKTGPASGSEVYVAYAAETTGAAGPYAALEWVAFLYHHYTWSPTYFHYELRLWVGKYNQTTNTYDSEEHVLISGDEGPTSQPDDLSVKEIEIYDFDGKPVVVWGYQQFDYNSADGYWTYGIWYDGKVTQTEPIRFTYADKYCHDVFGSEVDLGFLGYGKVWAFGIYTDIDVSAETVTINSKD